MAEARDRNSINRYLMKRENISQLVDCQCMVAVIATSGRWRGKPYSGEIFAKIVLYFFVLIEIYAKFDFVMKKEDYIYSLDIDVRDYELDSEGIVNNANYLHYLEVTRHEFCKAEGTSFDEMRRNGIIPVLSRVEIDYVTSLVSGDRMTSCLNLTRKGPRFVFQQDIYNQRGEVVVRAVVSVVSLENGRLSRGDKLAEAFAKYI